jgi:predicted Zn-dependent protease
VLRDTLLAAGVPRNRPLTVGSKSLFALILTCLLAARVLQGQSKPDDFEALAKSATTAREAAHTEQAVKDYRRALELRPNWEEGWWYLAVLEYDADHYSEAASAFKAVLKLEPTHGSAMNFLGLCEFETKDYPNSFQHLQEGQALGTDDDPDLARTSMYHLALLFNRAGDFDQAQKTIKRAFPDQLPPQARIALGIALLRIPLLPQEIEPSNDALVHDAGEIAAVLARGSGAKALSSLQELIRSHPTTPNLHYSFGLALAASSQVEEALREQRKELELSPATGLPQIELSRLLLGLHRNQEALRAAEAAVQAAPSSAAAHQLLAESLGALGQKEKETVERVAAKNLLPQEPLRDPHIVELYSIHTASGTPGVRGGVQRSTFEFDRFADSAAALESAGDVDGAIHAYQQALLLRPDWDDGRWAMAMLCYTANHYGQAISALKDLVGRKPENGTAWAVMGLAEFELNDYDNALIHLQRGQELGFGGSAESIDLANYRLGILLNRSGEFERATAILVAASTSKTLAKQIGFALGEALLHMKLLPEQVPAAREQLVLAAGAISTLLQSSKYDQALPQLRALIQKYPTTPFLHYAYAIALESLSQYDEAEQQFREEAKISPESALPYIRLASMALRTHHPDQALPSALQAVQFAPDSAEPHYVLGRSYLALDQNDLALNQLEAAKRLAPGSPEIHFNLAKAYGKLKQPEKEQEERDTFARLNALAEQARASRGTQSYGDTHGRSDTTMTSGAPTPHPE